MRSKIDSVLMANYIIEKCFEKGHPLDITKLSRLLYAVDGVLLANGYDIIKDSPEAWEFGPVYRKVFMKFRKDPELMKDYEFDFSKIKERQDFIMINKVIDLVLSKLGDYTGTELSDWAMKKNSPWDKTKQSNKINKNLIKRYFLGD